MPGPVSRIQRLILLALLLFSATVFSRLQASPSIPSAYQDVGHPITRQFPSDVHKSGNQVWWIQHDDNNLIYFATSNGMSRWDGENWEHYQTPKESIVRSLTRWKDGNVYAGTVNDVGFFSPQATGKLIWKSLMPYWVTGGSETPDIGETWSVTSNDYQVVYSARYALLSWNGEKLQKIENLNVKGARVFNVDGDIVVIGKEQNQVYRITDDEKPRAQALPWTVPRKLDVKNILRTQNNELLLISQRNGIYKLQDNNFVQIVKPQQLPEGTSLYNTIQAIDGYIYVVSIRNGIFILDAQYNLLRQYTEADGIGNSIILAVHEDNQGNIWLSGEPNISVMAPPHLRSVHRHNPNSGGHEELLTTGGELLSLATGVYQFKQNTNPLRSPSFEMAGTFGEKAWDAKVAGDQLIVGGESGIFAFDYHNGTISETSTRLLTSSNVQGLDVSADSQTIYAGENEYIYRLNKMDSQWLSTRVTGIRNLFEYLKLEYDENTQPGDEVIWASSSDATLYRLSHIDAEGKAAELQVFKSSANQLGDDNVAPFLIDGSMQIGISNGIYTYTGNPEAPFKLLQDVPAVLKTEGNDVFALHKDSQGRLIYQAGSHTGVAYRDNKNIWKTIEAPFNPFNDTGVRSVIPFNDAIWLKVYTGEVFRFSEAMLQQPLAAAPLLMRSITNINDNSLIRNFEYNEPLAPIPFESNSIRLAFALTDHSTPFQTEYRARISGQGHQNWTTWSTEAHKDFPLLAGGDYLFEVQARDPWQRIQGASLEFTIMPPWYLTRTAWATYFLLALLLLFLSGWLTQRWRTRQLTELNVALEQTVAERTQEVSAKVDELKEQQKLKDRFFSNVSHEFRTPLTLIIGPLETILDEYTANMEGKAKSLTATALNNANKMLALVGQVLDLNRLEVGKLPLRISEYDIAELLRNIQGRFESWAQQENQTITCENCAEPVLLYFDQDQIDKCVANLLSNAIKYSGKHSQLTINLINEQGSVTLQVIDNGRGISEEAKTRVFERFYQDKASEQNTTPGTGIGLSLVKELIELHHGKVGLTSELGKGCCFSLTLKKGKQHFAQEQLVEPLALAASNGEKAQRISLAETILTEDNNEQDQTTLLIIDDNAELRQFLSLRLSATYRIIQAQDGEEGFRLACEELPDLIVSDVMMPKLTGYELTKKLKSIPATRSIPVILLTARASKRETVEGFASGADDYLTKPFDTSELIMRVNAQINTRKTIRDSIQFEQSVEITGIKQKSPFVESIHSQVLTHLSDPMFSVEALARLLFVSRATLTRKCKDELTTTPGAYITQARMQHARNLLQANTLSVSEIAYAVGFESLAYFSRSFKKHTGTPPSEYVSH